MGARLAGHGWLLGLLVVLATSVTTVAGQSDAPSGLVGYFPLPVDGLGQELWRTDGTVDGTFVLRDIGPGELSGGPWLATNIVGTSSGLHFFIGNDGEHGQELWVTDGTHAGTRMVVDLTAGPNSTFFESLAAVDDQLYFMAIAPDQSSLWRTNGIDTVHVGPVGREVYVEPPAPRPFATTGAMLFFPAFEAKTGVELWRTDGSGKGTRSLADVLPGADASWPSDLTVAGQTLFFGARDGEGGVDLWRSDGTRKGTQLLSDGPFENLTAAGNRAFFTTTDAAGTKLWLAASDAVEPVASILGHRVGHAFAVDRALLLVTTDDEGASSLWATDETGGSPVTVGTVGPPTPILPSIVRGSRVFFFADTTEHHASELWVAAATGTVNLGRFAEGGNANVTDVVAAGQGVVFVVRDHVARTVTLWRSDGTVAGTVPLADPFPTGSGSGPAREVGSRPTPGCLKASRATLVVDERGRGHAHVRARLSGFERFIGRQDFMGPLIERRVVTARLFDEFERELGSLVVATTPDTRCTGSVSGKRRLCWSGTSLNVRFRDPEHHRGAVERLLLRGGKRGRIAFVAQIDEGSFPPGLSEAIGNAATIEVNLQSRGSCFRARVTGAARSNGKVYRASAGSARRR